MLLEAWATFSLYSTMFLGVGVVLLASSYVWSIAFNRLLIQFRMQREFMDFVWKKYKNKRYEGE
jgi:hypothetical protein